MPKTLYKYLRKIPYLSTPLYLTFFYESFTGHKLDLNKPKRFNEKLQWLKCYFQPPLLTQLADKYTVREYVEDKVGSKYLNELYGVYKSAAEIDFDALPNSFVLKTNHSYRTNIIVKDKNDLDIEDAKAKLDDWLTYSLHEMGGRQWAYKNIEPRIIAEAFLNEPNEPAPIDYKFFCFGGEPKFLKIDVGRGTDLKRQYYNPDWTPIDALKEGDIPLNESFPKPANYDEMMSVVRKLAGTLPFSRVDLYNIEGRIIFGEITFYPASGITEFIPDHYNIKFGDMLELPAIPNGQEKITSWPM